MPKILSVIQPVPYQEFVRRVESDPTCVVRKFRRHVFVEQRTDFERRGFPLLQLPDQLV